MSCHTNFHLSSTSSFSIFKARTVNSAIGHVATKNQHPPLCVQHSFVGRPRRGWIVGAHFMPDQGLQPMRPSMRSNVLLDWMGHFWDGFHMGMARKNGYGTLRAVPDVWNKELSLRGLFQTSSKGLLFDVVCTYIIYILYKYIYISIQYNIYNICVCVWTYVNSYVLVYS